MNKGKQHRLLKEAYLWRGYDEDSADRMARADMRTCYRLAYNRRTRKFSADDFEEFTSVAIVAACEGKGKRALLAIRDYQRGRCPETYGCGRGNSVPFAPVADETENPNARAPLDLAAGGYDPIEDVRVTDQRGREHSDPVPVPELASSLMRAWLERMSETDPEGVEAFEVLYLSTCFPGAKRNTGMSQEETAKELKTSVRTLKRRADRIARKIFDNDLITMGPAQKRAKSRKPRRRKVSR